MKHYYLKYGVSQLLCIFYFYSHNTTQITCIVFLNPSFNFLGYWNAVINILISHWSTVNLLTSSLTVIVIMNLVWVVIFRHNECGHIKLCLNITTQITCLITIIVTAVIWCSVVSLTNNSSRVPAVQHYVMSLRAVCILLCRLTRCASFSKITMFTALTKSYCLLTVQFQKI